MVKTQFPEWLSLLAQASHGPLILPACVRAREYRPVLEIEGDWRSATMAGQVKSAPNAATALATFGFGTGTLFVEAGGTYTRFANFGLTATATGALPALPEGVDAFLFDIVANGQRLVGGLLPVSGFVTSGA